MVEMEGRGGDGDKQEPGRYVCSNSMRMDENEKRDGGAVAVAVVVASGKET